MGLWANLFGKKIASMREVGDELRADVEDLLNDGYSTEDICNELGMDYASEENRRVIYKIKEAMTRRTERRSSRSSPGIRSAAQDPTETMQQQLLQLEIQKKKQEIEFDIEDKKEMRKLAKLKELREWGLSPEDDEDVEEEDPMAMILKAILMGSMAGKTNGLGGMVAAGSPIQASPIPPSPGNLIDLTDDEIYSILERFPEQLPYIQKLPDSVLLKLLHQKIPGMTEATYERALGCIKKKEVEINVKGKK